MFAVLPINATSSSGQRSEGGVTIASVNQNGTPIYGYYALVCSQGTSGYANGTNNCDSPPYNARYASGFTTATFTNFGVPANQTVGIEVENYGSCTFSHWMGANSLNNFELVQTANPPITYTAVYNCSSSLPSVTISSQNQNGQAINGYYVVLYNSQGSVAGTGFTPKTLSTVSGNAYSVRASSYKSCTFNHWSNGVTSNPMPFTATSSAQTFTAVYNCGTSGPSSVTVNSVNQNGNAISGYYTILRTSGGSTVGTGFTPKTFSTTSGQSYTIQAASYGSCIFSHWSDGQMELILTPCHSLQLLRHRHSLQSIIAVWRRIYRHCQLCKSEW